MWLRTRQRRGASKRTIYAEPGGPGACSNGFSTANSGRRRPAGWDRASGATRCGAVLPCPHGQATLCEPSRQGIWSKTVEFCTALGFSFNPDFTDENATCMIVNDGAYVMLLVESYFKSFTSKSVAATSGTAEVIMSFSAGEPRSRGRGHPDRPDLRGHTVRGSPGYGFMYTRSFQDPDGPCGKSSGWTRPDRRRTQRCSPFCWSRPGSRRRGTLSTCLDMYGCCP